MNQKTPLTARILTLFGLAPFFLTALLMLIFRNDPGLKQAIALWLIVYGAVILSFLGGIRWGAEIVRSDTPRPGTLIGSVLAPLLAWAIVIAYILWRPTPLFLLAQTCVFVILWAWDRQSSDLPVWFRDLRLWPTLGAAAALCAGAYLLS